MDRAIEDQLFDRAEEFIDIARLYQIRACAGSESRLEIDRIRRGRMEYDWCFGIKGSDGLADCRAAFLGQPRVQND
jgi:hypothetical protein